jgi:para-aminobenzoate synthetase component I
MVHAVGRWDKGGALHSWSAHLKIASLKTSILPLPLVASPTQVFARLQKNPGVVLLESSKDMPGLSAWSWVSGPALATLSTPAHERTQLTRCRDGVVLGSWADPFEALGQVLAQIKVAPSQQIAFCGGLVGYLGYDLARHIEPLPSASVADPAWPWMHLYLCDHVLAFEHATQRWYFCSQDWPHWHAESRSAVWQRTLAAANAPCERPLAARTSFQAQPLQARTPPAIYLQQVQQVLDYIAAGDIFQANLSHRFEAAFTGDPFALYLALTAANPAPFSAYMQGPNFALASVSPERFLKLSGSGQAVARPIKGTLPRHIDASLDAQTKAVLQSSEKNRAENLMIVDLMRNDLGRVAQVGSVKVQQLFEIEAHPSVWQMVSTITAQLRPGEDAANLLRACWPPGSMTGAPKVRAMQIIDQLEPVQRGPYAGAIGYLDASGAMDLSVVIRTAMVYGKRVFLQLGGGIVADSEPALELQETHDKGRLLMQVLAQGLQLNDGCSLPRKC